MSPFFIHFYQKNCIIFLIDDKYNFIYNERWIGLIDRQVLFIETVNDY